MLTVREAKPARFASIRLRTGKYRDRDQQRDCDPDGDSTLCNELPENVEDGKGGKKAGGPITSGKERPKGQRKQSGNHRTEGDQDHGAHSDT